MSTTAAMDFTPSSPTDPAQYWAEFHAGLPSGHNVAPMDDRIQSLGKMLPEDPTAQHGNFDDIDEAFEGSCSHATPVLYSLPSKPPSISSSMIVEQPNMQYSRILSLF